MELVSTETRYIDDNDGSSISIDPMAGEGSARLAIFAGESTLAVDLDAETLALFLVDLRDVAGIVEQKRPCGCTSDERRPIPQCLAASGDEHEMWFCELPEGHARGHQFTRRD
jgi:hypothetical protein